MTAASTPPACAANSSCPNSSARRKRSPAPASAILSPTSPSRRSAIRTVMLLAERGGIRNLGLSAENAFAYPDEARVLRYQIDAGGVWQPAGRYDVGFNDRKNEGPALHPRRRRRRRRLRSRLQPGRHGRPRPVGRLRLDDRRRALFAGRRLPRPRNRRPRRHVRGLRAAGRSGVGLSGGHSARGVPALSRPRSGFPAGRPRPVLHDRRRRQRRCLRPADPRGTCAERRHPHRRRGGLPTAAGATEARPRDHQARPRRHPARQEATAPSR